MTTDRTLDPGALERLLDITGGDLEFLDELVDTYLDDAAVQLAAMRGAADEGDAEGLVRPAHSLKSNSDNVGAVTLTTLCRELEAAGRSGTVPDAQARVGAIELEFATVRDALLALRADRGAGGP